MRKTLTGLRPAVAELKAADAWRQFVCRILYRHLQVLSGSERTSAEFIEDLVEAITFCESDFLDWLCSWVDMDPEVYLGKSRELFLALPAEIRAAALKGAALRWERKG